jgi:glutamate carboxypeptidase
VGARDLRKASAVLELAHKTIGLEELNEVFPGVRVNVGKVEGGLGPATIPASAQAWVDIRWEDQGVRNRLVERIRDVVGKPEVPGCHSELTLLNERSAWPWSEGTQKLADLVKRVSAELGHPIDQEHRLGTSDSNFFGCAGVPTVDGLGPICEGYHTANEFVYVSSIPERTALLAASLLEIAREMA